MREIKFRGKQKLTNKWVYGNLIIKKTKLGVEALDKELYRYKYSIQYFTEAGTQRAVEVFEDSIGQYLGTNEYGEIYENMELYDTYLEENCYIVYDDEECAFREVHNEVSERMDSLTGLIPYESGLVEKVDD